MDDARKEGRLELEIQRQVGMRIREVRNAANLTAVELARRAGISQGQLSKIENGKASLSIKVLAALCLVLDRPVSYLFQSEAEMPRVLGTLTTVKGPESEGIQWFAREVKQGTSGRLALIPLRAGQLGSATDQAEQLRGGVIDLFVEELYCLQSCLPLLAVFSLPYLFRDEGHRRLFLEGRFFEKNIRAPLLKQGIRFLNRRWNWRRGLEWVLLSRTAIDAPGQLRGRRVRIPTPGLSARFWEAFDAEPVVVQWPDVRNALKTGLVDVLPTHKSHLYPLRLCKHARYITLLGDLPPVLGVGINEKRFQVLAPDIQQILHSACDRAGDHFSETVRTAEQENERLNIRKFKAAYLRVDVASWQKEARRATQKLFEDGHLPRTLMAAIADSRRRAELDTAQGHCAPAAREVYEP